MMKTNTAGPQLVETAGQGGKILLTLAAAAIVAGAVCGAVSLARSAQLRAEQQAATVAAAEADRARLEADTPKTEIAEKPAAAPEASEPAPAAEEETQPEKQPQPANADRTPPPETAPATPNEVAAPPPPPTKEAPHKGSAPETKPEPVDETAEAEAAMIATPSKARLNNDEEELVVVAKRDVDPKAGPALAKPVALPPPCARCLGTGFLPLKPFRNYIHVFAGAATNPAAAVPWDYCPLCQKGQDPKTLVEIETTRLTQAAAAHAKWEQSTGLKFVVAETHYFTLHSELSPQQTRNVAYALEELAGHLQSLTQKTILTRTRPDTHELIILKDQRSYNTLIDALEKSRAYPDNNWDLTRKASGEALGNLGFFYMARATPPENVAVFLAGGMMIENATNSKAPVWLAEGFRAYCENAITGRNLTYSFEYEMNAVRLGQNWRADIRSFAQQGKLKTWDKIFRLDLIGMKPLDYLTCFSMAAYLLKTDAQRFLALVGEFGRGVPSVDAIEKVYAKKIPDLQMMWAQWALEQR